MSKEEHVMFMKGWGQCRKKPMHVYYRAVQEKELLPNVEEQADIMGETIKTLEGTLFAFPHRDYIIEGVNGELYPIRKSIFEKTYDIIVEADEGVK